MKEKDLRELLQQVAAGEVSPSQAVERVRGMPFEDIGFAKIDHHRILRCGVPEVVFCEGKTPRQVADISERIVAAGGDLLATRAEREHYAAVQEKCPGADYREAARCITYRHEAAEPAGLVVVLTGGTADLPVAEEAVVTAEMLGARVELIGDVGVAGLHRLLAHREKLQQANALIVVAGMEGALASVVGGLVARPVIGVPTSVGYGASFGGVAPLLTMLNSCAAGVAVVNIDNGFGAGHIAALINAMAARTRGEA
ncbi:MAG: nickel pincer cofactor biosynthesis protein LarB [Candidatus Brocadiaceae bacterium]|jgi:hypothetical protein